MGARASITLQPRRARTRRTEQESQMNNSTRGQKPAPRPLPGGMPEYIAVEIIESEYEGQPQWVARYPLYENGNASDFIDIVVNFPRHFRPWDVGENRWWVKPSSMAPQKRLVFVQAVGRVRHHDAPLTIRTGGEVLVKFGWSRDNRDYRAKFEGWTVVMKDGNNICQDELWRVRVAQIDACSGLIYVNSVGPHPKAVYMPPMSVGYLGITPLFANREALEGDVFSYFRSGWESPRGGSLNAEIEHKGRVIRLECSELRKMSVGREKDGRAIEKIVGVVSRDGTAPFLAELVLIEGETVQKPQLLAIPAPRRVEPPVEEQDSLNDPDYGIDILIEEERENSEPPDRGDYD